MASLARRLARRVRNRLIGKPAMPEGVQVLAFDGVQIPLDFSQHTHRMVHHRGYFEPDLTRVLLQSVREGDVFLDIGTNFGWHSLQLAVNGPALAAMYAVEPSSRSMGLFLRGLEANDLGRRIETFQLALGREEGNITLKHFSGPNLGLVNSSVYPLADYEYEEEAVRLTTLDTLARGFQAAPAVIKCDVEGSEMDVLHGAEALLSGELGPPPMWFLEANYETSGMAGYFPWQLIDKAREHAPYRGYVLRETIVEMPHPKALRHGDTLVLAVPDLHKERLARSGAASE